MQGVVVLVATACCALPISIGAESERNGSNHIDLEKFQYWSSLLLKGWREKGYGIRKIKLPQEHFWLVLLKLEVAAGVLWLAKTVHP